MIGPLLLNLAFGVALAQETPTEAPVEPPAEPLVEPTEEPTEEPVITGHIDWQAHPSMHMTWRMFGEGLTDVPPDDRTWKHQFKQTVYTPWLEDSDVRIFLTAAMAAEKAHNPRQARQLILDQIAHVEAFAASHPDRFAVARTPAEARKLLEDPDIMVLVHSIEGGRKILRDPGDAQFWADQGVALMTVTHLFHDELGGAALNSPMQGWFLSPRGSWKRLWGADRSLTARGREAIAELGEAGVLVDLTHMSPSSVAESLELTADISAIPVVTHGKLSSLMGDKDERAFTDAQVVEIYRQGGAFNLILNGGSLDPMDPPEGYCPSSMDGFLLHHQTLRALLDGAAEEILPTREDPPEVALASGWASDWNGWTSHSQPRYGRKGCPDEAEGTLAIDTLGLAHPGLLPQHWERLEARGLDADPLEHSAEQFLRMWERARGER